MNVLIISAFPPDPAPEANHALHLSEHLAQAGLAVHVLCKKGSIESTQPGLVIHPVIDDWAWPDAVRLAKCMRACQPDVVLLLYIGWIYNHHPMITFLPTLCKEVLPGVPCVTQFENIDDGFPPRALSTRAVRTAVAFWAGTKDVHRVVGTLVRDSAQLIFLSSPHRAKLATQCPEVEEKSVILPPPPLIRVCAEEPSQVRLQIRDAIGALESDFVLIYWGYIYPGKGVETLLKAFRIVCRRSAKIRLVIVGGSLDFPTGPISCGDYFKMVRRLPEQLGIADRVTWTGDFDWDSDTGSRYLRAGDACVLPFDYGVTLNNSSLAAASTHGLPVVATELPVGQDEMLEHGRNIYLCPSRKPDELAEAIELIVSSSELHERLRAGITALARQWHDWTATTERLVGILESVTRKESCLRGRADRAPRPAVGSAGWHEDVAAENGDAYEGRGMPAVSIIVAVHNVGKYLSQCLDSLVNQTLKNLEIIVVNDASQDNSPDIAKEYKAKYPGLVRMIHCEANRGLASVRNIGMRVARGGYIGFTDGDDWADVRMCEVMYRRAREDNADVVIADATVFYEQSKAFGQFFDQHIRATLSPELRERPFDLSVDPRVLLLEPVAWTKMYRRAFLQKHALQFEDGMNSYEDMCFHFSVLLKAKRMSLLDKPLSFYRQNRPGQISGRTSRKIFEVFAVFDKIHENLSEWEVSPEIWGLFVRVQLRQFDWLLRDRVPARDKLEFIALAGKQLAKVPASGFRAFARDADPDDLPKLSCLRRGWLRGYEHVTRFRWPLFPILYLMLNPPRIGIVKCLSYGRMLRSRMAGWVQACAGSVDLADLDARLQRVDEKLSELRIGSRADQPLVEVHRIGDQKLFISRSSRSGLVDAVWRMQNDFYLSRTAIFRENDTVVDVGAHLGVVSIYLAKKYPFIRVYAVEADPENYECLRRNIELNGVANVTAINKAVAGVRGKRVLYTHAWDSAWATIDANLAADQQFIGTAMVDGVTLEDLFLENGIRHCRMLKVTAPGAVGKSLKAFTRTGCVDLLCGEADIRDCSRGELETISWRIARQHFWRVSERRGEETFHRWIHDIPRVIEQPEGDGRLMKSHGSEALG